VINPSYDIKSYHEHIDNDPNSYTRNTTLQDGQNYYKNMNSSYLIPPETIQLANKEPVNFYNLLIPLFEHKIHGRNEEFKKSILKNVENIFIKHIYILFQDYTSTNKYFDYLNNSKITIIPVTKRQTYLDFTKYINLNLRHEINIIANTDIWFDDSINNLKYINFNNTMVCLTRYDSCKNYAFHTETGVSHDAWIFNAPIKEAYYEIVMGVLGCDSYFNQICKEIGYRILCPSYDIKCYHEHSDNDHMSITRNNKLSDGTTYGYGNVNWKDLRIKSHYLLREKNI
jgi:hypothetical protein